MTETDSSFSSPAASGDAPNNASPSHYERIGGAPAVKAAVELFYERVLADPDLVGYFEKIEMEQQRRHLVLLFTKVLGGPDNYAGRGLAEAHQPLNIPLAHYAKVGVHLLASLAELGVPEDVRADVQTVLNQVQGQVVAHGN